MELLDTHTDSRRVDRDDFAAFLVEYQVDTDLMNEQIQNTADQVPFPPGGWPLELKPSGVHGLGLFATHRIEAGALIAPARVASMRTPAGRYTNHSPCPNAHMARRGDDIDLIASMDVEQGAEVLVDYRAALAVNLEGPAHE